VDFPIKFNDQFCLGAVEIYNVSADSVLAAKFVSAELLFAEELP